MPRYDYQCEDCGHSFELKQSFSSEPNADCPKCQGVSRRQFHSVPIMFKGSGWYVNDYGKRASPSATSSDSPDSKEKSDSGETKSKSKSEAKPDSAAKEKTKATSNTAKASTD